MPSLATEDIEVISRKPIHNYVCLSQFIEQPFRVNLDRQLVRILHLSVSNCKLRECRNMFCYLVGDCRWCCYRLFMLLVVPVSCVGMLPT